MRQQRTLAVQGPVLSRLRRLRRAVARRPTLGRRRPHVVEPRPLSPGPGSPIFTGPFTVVRTDGTLVIPYALFAQGGQDHVGALVSADGGIDVRSARDGGAARVRGRRRPAVRRHALGRRRHRRQDLPRLERRPPPRGRRVERRRPVDVGERLHVVARRRASRCRGRPQGSRRTTSSPAVAAAPNTAGRRRSSRSPSTRCAFATAARRSFPGAPSRSTRGSCSRRTAAGRGRRRASSRRAHSPRVAGDDDARTHARRLHQRLVGRREAVGGPADRDAPDVRLFTKRSSRRPRRDPALAQLTTSTSVALTKAMRWLNEIS